MAFIIEEVDANDEGVMFDRNGEVLFWITREEVAEIWDCFRVKSYDTHPFWEDLSERETKKIEREVIKVIQDYVHNPRLIYQEPGNALKDTLYRLIDEIEEGY